MADHPQGRSTFFTRLLATALIAVLPLLALQIHELVRQKRLDEAAVVAQLQARVERSSVGFEAAIARIENLVQFVATRPELQQLDRERCGALVRGLAQIDPLLANVGAVDLEGRLLCLAQQPSAPQASYANAPWFADALRGTAAGATHLGRPYVGDVTRKWLVNLVRPLHDPGGRRVGMIAAAIDLQKVAERLLSPSGLPQGSVMALIDADGRFLAREPDLAGFAGKPLPPALLEAASAAAGRPFSGVAANRVHGIFITSTALRFGVRVGAGSPLAEVVAKGEQDFRRSLVVALGALALGALAAAFGARRLAAPLRSLAASARAQAAGDNDARADETLPGEFHTLAREFNAMLDARKAGEVSQRAQAAAEAASEAKSEFLAHMSHEIRTPMNAIVGLTELTLRTPLTPQQAGYLGKARQAADTLLALIDRILDFSKIESGKLELDRSPFLLDEVLDRVTVIVGHRAQEKGLEFLIGVAREVPQQLLGDGQRLTQVLVNLCGNAVKFTERGEVVLMVSCSAADASQATLRFSVRDTGIGISAEHQARLFQPFTQADASTARRFGGSGLGLVISRQLVELMGGHLALRSEPGHGSEFIFDARFGRATGALPAAAAGAPTGTVAGLHVLVVDDSATARELLVDQLQALGCSAEALPSADAALQRLDDTARPTPDLVLLDWRMPEVDGLEAARRIQARPAPAPKLVLVTAYGDDAIAQRAREQGLDACLAKHDPARAGARARGRAARRRRRAGRRPRRAGHAARPARAAGGGQRLQPAGGRGPAARGGRHAGGHCRQRRRRPAPSRRRRLRHRADGRADARHGRLRDHAPPARHAGPCPPAGGGDDGPRQPARPRAVSGGRHGRRGHQADRSGHAVRGAGAAAGPASRAAAGPRTGCPGRRVHCAGPAPLHGPGRAVPPRRPALPAAVGTTARGAAHGRGRGRRPRPGRDRPRADRGGRHRGRRCTGRAGPAAAGPGRGRRTCPLAGAARSDGARRRRGRSHVDGLPRE